MEERTRNLIDGRNGRKKGQTEECGKKRKKKEMREGWSYGGGDDGKTE